MKKKKSSPVNKNTVLLLMLLLFAFAWHLYSSDQEVTTTEYPSAEIDQLLQVEMPKDVKSQIIHYPGFVVSFNEEYHQPNWAAWELTREEVQANETSRNSATFTPDPSAPGCPTLADYKNSGYDRGHMCPAGDMKWSQESMNACFYLTNMCPQSNKLNNGAWKNLEEKCRTWAQRDSALVIICGPILSDRLTNEIGASRVPVPERFFKVVIAPYASPMRAIGFIMPNGKVEGGMQAAAMSVDEVEAITGFDFFSALPDDIEDKVEAQGNLPKWEHK